MLLGGGQEHEKLHQGDETRSGLGEELGELRREGEGANGRELGEGVRRRGWKKCYILDFYTSAIGFDDAESVIL